ncbi:MAG: four-carbon acid sugar kinase family protein [bacterium]|nr:four-carbon acid sugar kinase family protein [bacterium]
MNENRNGSYLKRDRIPQPTLLSSARATAIYTNSRALGFDQARRRLVSVAHGLGEIKALQIYKKIDSCMRGNVGSESDALLDQLGYETSFITPAFPEMGRTTLEDTHRIHGIPLDRTEISLDPVTPVTDSSLTRIVALQSRYPVGHVGLKFLENDHYRLNEEIERQLSGGVRHVVFDAANRYKTTGGL